MNNENKCRFCKKKINPDSKVKLCPDCDIKKMRLIKEYIISHPGAKAAEIAKGINLDPFTTREYLDDDRFIFKSTCKSCKTVFEGLGDYCPKCMEKRRSAIIGLGNAFKEEPKQEVKKDNGPKWHLR